MTVECLSFLLYFNITQILSLFYNFDDYFIISMTNNPDGNSILNELFDINLKTH